MSGHLSARQMDACLIGEINPETETHLRQCERCRTQLESTRATLSSFGQSVSIWSDSQLPPNRPGEWNAAGRSLRFPLLAWDAVIAIAVCVLLVFALRWHQPRPVVSDPAADAALLTRIDAEVSRAVPAPMEPLTEFVVDQRQPVKE